MNDEPASRPPLTGVPPSTSRRDLIGIVVAGLVWAAATALLAPALRDPGHVDHITIDNPHPWDVTIDATDGGRDGWAGIGGLARDDADTFQSVLDRGDTWIFRFAYGGEEAELRISRQHLEQSDWHVTVPAEFAKRLRSAGVPETPL